MTHIGKKIFYKFGASYIMSHDNYFCGKNWCCCPTKFQKQKTESIYLIPKNNYDPFQSCQ